MGKMIEQSRKNGVAAKRQLAQMRRERRKLAACLSKLDAHILSASAKEHRPLSPRDFQDWLDEMSADLPDLQPLPADFGRAEIYDDHD